MKQAAVLTLMTIFLTFCLVMIGTSEGARVTGGDSLVTTSDDPPERREPAEAPPTVLEPMRPAVPPTRAPVIPSLRRLPSVGSQEIKQEEGEPTPGRVSAARSVPEIPEGEGQYITIDFDNVDIRVFVKFISEITGKNFIVDPNVRANVTVISPRKISVQEAYRVFESVLEVHGFTTVPSGDVTKIIPAVAAREKSVETLLREEAISPEDRVVTRIVPLRYANPTEMQKVLTPLVSRASIIISYPPTGTLIITDVLSNIERLMNIVETLDVAGIEEHLSVIPLDHARADEVAGSLNQVFQTARRPQAGVVEGPVTIVPDARTNVIIVYASDYETYRIRQLIELLDREVPRRVDRIRVYRLQNAEAESLAQVLMDIPRGDDAQRAEGGVSKGSVLSKDVQIIPDKATNSLIITAGMDDYLALEEVIQKLDIPRAMVYIEALIMEVNVDRDFRLGTEWTGAEYISTTEGRAKVYGGGFRGRGIIPVPDSDTGLITMPEGFSLGVMGQDIKIGDISFPNLGAVFQAYQKDSNVHILSTPQLLTLDNEEAEIYVGENVPYQTRAETTDTLRDYSSYEYRDVGVTLRITPQINQEQFVRLAIFQEITKLTSSAQATNFRPSTLKRTATTTVSVKDKNTVVIGGLIGDDVETSTWQVPCFGRLPLLGWFFKQETETREKRNLYIFITPHILENPEEAAALYEERKERIDSLEEATVKPKRLQRLLQGDEGGFYD